MPDYIIGFDMALGADMTVLSRKCKDCGIMFPVPSPYSARARCSHCSSKNLLEKISEWKAGNNNG